MEMRNRGEGDGGGGVRRHLYYGVFVVVTCVVSLHLTSRRLERYFTLISGRDDVLRVILPSP